ncbi:MAG: hydroxyisourate hydrolase [Planctomycetota bacterium]
MSTGKLTTHVLDTAHGKPAAGVLVRLSRELGEQGFIDVIGSWETNEDGRVDAPLIEGSRFRTGRYELSFAIGRYFKSIGHSDAARFLDVVPIVFHIADSDQHYHVPLLVSPWSYSTYRGS